MEEWRRRGGESGSITGIQIARDKGIDVRFNAGEMRSGGKCSGEDSVICRRGRKLI